MAGIQRAIVTTKRCPMSDDVCAAKVIEHLSNLGVPNAAQVVEEKCGRFKSGKTPGKLRGWASIAVCTEGGWKRNGPGEGNGRVVYPGTILGVAITDFYGKAYVEAGEVD
jgi:hypothetical protein